MNRVLIIISVAFSTTLLLVACGVQREVSSSQSSHVVNTIPFRLTEHNNIIITAVFNDVDTVDMMFHTAISAISLIKETTVNTTSIVWTDEAAVYSWGGESEARYSAHNKVQIAAMVWDSMSITEGELSGHYSGGKFGPDLFEDYILEIDFERRQLQLYNQLPSDIDSYDKISFNQDMGSIMIPATLDIGDTSINEMFMLHSGYSGAILLSDTIANHYELAEKLKITGEQILRDSYNNEITTIKAILPRLVFGGSTIDSIGVGFFKGMVGRQRYNILGGDIIKRYNWYIDAAHDMVYVKANTQMTAASE